MNKVVPEEVAPKCKGFIGCSCTVDRGSCIVQILFATANLYGMKNGTSMMFYLYARGPHEKSVENPLLAEEFVETLKTFIHDVGTTTRTLMF